jgi:ketosteroid isomerase-like protein
MTSAPIEPEALLAGKKGDSENRLRRSFRAALAVFLGIVAAGAGQQRPVNPRPPVAVSPIVYLPTPTPGPPPPSVDLPPELDRVLRDYERAWHAKNAEALSRLFTEDGFVMGNGAPPARGREAIRRAYARSGGPLVLRALAFETEKSVGYIVGAFGRSAETGDTGKFVLVLRRENGGRWMIAADIDNSNSRPMPPSPTPTARPYSPVVPHSAN